MTNNRMYSLLRNAMRFDGMTSYAGHLRQNLFIILVHQAEPTGNQLCSRCQVEVPSSNWIIYNACNHGMCAKCCSNHIDNEVTPRIETTQLLEPRSLSKLNEKHQRRSSTCPQCNVLSHRFSMYCKVAGTFDTYI